MLSQAVSYGQGVCIQVGTYGTGCLLAHKVLLKKDQDIWPYPFSPQSFICRFPSNSSCCRKTKRLVSNTVETSSPITMSVLFFINRFCSIVKSNSI